VAVVVLLVPTWLNGPLELFDPKMSYPVTPTLSVEAVQLNVTCSGLQETRDVRLVGTVGGWVSVPDAAAPIAAIGGAFRVAAWAPGASAITTATAAASVADRARFLTPLRIETPHAVYEHVATATRSSNSRSFKHGRLPHSNVSM
jgi:hypothetical protein